jgi:hypothetical protein
MGVLIKRRGGSRREGERKGEDGSSKKVSPLITNYPLRSKIALTVGYRYLNILSTSTSMGLRSVRRLYCFLF